MRSEQIEEFRSFVSEQETAVKSIRNCLRIRNFKDGQNVACDYLDAVRPHLATYEDIDDYSQRLDLITGVVCSWEVADSSNMFNPENIRRTSFDALTDFAERRLFELKDVREMRSAENLPAEPEFRRRYLIATARAVLIRIGENYRAQRDLAGCWQELNEVISFAISGFNSLTITRPNSLLAQCYFYAAKLARSDGDLEMSRDNLLRGLEAYREKSFALSKLVPNEEATLKLNEIQMRTGVLQVSYAWNYFSQGRYETAIQTALSALLMLAGTKDRITQNHAELALFAARRAGAVEVGEIQMIIERLSRISEKFGKYKQFRLKRKADYELIQAHINLDAILDADSSDDRLDEIDRMLDFYRTKPAKSRKWESLYKTLESRLERRRAMEKRRDRNFTLATNYALEALRLAKDVNSPLCRLEALIALGESYFYQHRHLRNSNEKSTVSPENANEQSTVSLENAQAAFMKADKICEDLCKDGGFPDLNGVVKLYLARIALKSGDDQLSAYYLNRFNALDNRQHGRLKRLEKRVVRERDESNINELRIESNNFAANQVKLKEILIKRAKASLKGSRNVTEEMIATELGVTRQTLASWRSQIKARKRTSIALL